MKKNNVRLVVVLLVGFGMWVPVGVGAVRFDGLRWYHSEDPNRLILNEDYQG